MKIFCFVKKVFFIGLTTLSGFTNANSLGSISVNNQECKTKDHNFLMLIEMSLCFFSIKTCKCSGSCNNINYLYAKNFCS